jgi:endonuclease YncB( thermonuclease family)
MMRMSLTAVIAAALALACAPQAQAQVISGPAEAGDGDSLTLTGTRIRLFGFDAPELNQTCDRGGEAWRCGEAAKAELAKLIEGNQVSCEARDTDAYGRLVATCRVGRVDLGEAMVGAGWATAFTQYGGDYVEAEARAKKFKLGIWAANFETPANYRAAHPREAPKAERASVTGDTPVRATVYRDRAGGCLIKGNHSRRGEWIYHLPGQEYYDQTRPEALFCTEEAAQRAGYRRSKS